MYKNRHLSIFIVAFSVMMIGASAAAFTVGSINTVFASTEASNNDQSSSSQTDHEQPTLETVDTHLEECIQQIENDNTDDALNECQLADEELHSLLVNSTGQ
ncbi:MAG TPA: hypothetical protein VFV86_11940 [Nitrososphaeraceae archaeon]|nr:hypothetical protein [Nitrososphaeraceae archaeon]